MRIHTRAHTGERGQSLRSNGENNQRIPATPLVAQLVPRDLANGGVLRTGARQVDDDEFLALCVLSVRRVDGVGSGLSRRVPAFDHAMGRRSTRREPGVELHVRDLLAAQVWARARLEALH